ncbi:hypothetical protein [Micromonospora sp. RV43]|uniref:DUF7352 domain-containing protein n=1 Tax=Micromonospora sp. RV43 TaxID=1661387 RepID=UPI00064C4832|nr:hypothetical protein [Micromonospora sp. RV43]
MPERRIFRYEVPVDDQWHTRPLSGAIVQVGAQRADVVEFWAFHFSGAPQLARRFRVFGTGQPMPDEAGTHVGAVVVAAPFGRLVWHLMEHAQSGPFIAEGEAMPA